MAVHVRCELTGDAAEVFEEWIDEDLSAFDVAGGLDKLIGTLGPGFEQEAILRREEVVRE